jgi:D-alanyl-lipoteichoic acid acyltransferase DltB (MBOAT superfamily)
VLFNSFIFVWFFLVVYGLYLLFRRSNRAQNWLLLIGSYVFYGWWDWRFLMLLWTSTAIDFVVARALDTTTVKRRRTWLLLVSISANLAILGTFKYFNFFAESFEPVLRTFGLQPDFVTLKLILPVGISFYTFQSMGYTIDVFRKRIPANKNLLQYALYVAFFPQLVAGPIERAANLLPQIKRKRIITSAQVNAGLSLIIWGFFKKMVIADQLGLIADELFDGHSELEGMESFVAVLAFTGQIYGDFSGYSDIARGLAKLMGFELMVNFKLPYFATNPAEFWTRWHVSLSSWIRDYLYIPLGGNRNGKFRTYINLMVVMALAGLWHGAAWNFVIWGAYHGVALVIHRIWNDARVGTGTSLALSSRLRFWAQVAVMFAVTSVGWLIFRSDSVTQIGDMITSASPTFTEDSLRLGYKLAFFAAPLVIVQLVQHRTNDLMIMTKAPRIVQAVIYGFFLIWIVIFSLREPSEFIYFQF